MDGDLAPLADLVEIAERHGALVIVDEAHATGLFGARGAGRVEELGLSQRVLATVHTGGKALGSAGAWVAGSRLLVDTLAQLARSFLFTTAPMPALAGALNAALDIVAAEPDRRAEVHRKARLLRGAFAAGGVADLGPLLPDPPAARRRERRRRRLAGGAAGRRLRLPRRPAAHRAAGHGAAAGDGALAGGGPGPAAVRGRRLPAAPGARRRPRA